MGGSNVSKPIIPLDTLYINLLPHGVLATFCLTAEGLIGPLQENDISWEKTILMTSLRTYKASAVRGEQLSDSYPASPSAGRSS